jgi:molybdenum cofactor cytidylyltransferase
VLAAIILSGGESSRMGSPKALLPYHGRPFLEHLLDVAQHPKIGRVLVVLGPHAEQILAAVKISPESVALNPEWKKGQLSSIQTGLRRLSEDSTAPATEGVVLFLVDQPLITGMLVDQLIAEFYRSGQPIIVPSFRGKRGHPVIFAQRLYSELMTAPLDQGARAVVWAHAGEVFEVPTDEEGVVLNLNNPETLRRALGG